MYKKISEYYVNLQNLNMLNYRNIYIYSHFVNLLPSTAQA